MNHTGNLMQHAVTEQQLLWSLMYTNVHFTNINPASSGSGSETTHAEAMLIFQTSYHSAVAYPPVLHKHHNIWSKIRIKAGDYCQASVASTYNWECVCVCLCIQSYINPNLKHIHSSLSGMPSFQPVPLCSLSFASSVFGLSLGFGIFACAYLDWLYFLRLMLRFWTLACPNSA